MGRFQVPNRIAIMYVVHTFTKLNTCGTFLIQAKYEDENSKAKTCGGNVIYHVIDSRNTIQLGSRCSEGINLTYVHND